MSDYYIRNNDVLQNMLGNIREIQSKGGIPKVTVKNERESRSDQQNNTMQMWFGDIARSTGNDRVYEAGRCKLRYFLPVMKGCANAKSAVEIIEMLLESRGYEYTCTVLGTSGVKSTRLLSIREFTEALEAMRMGEAEHYLRDPASCGIEWR